MKNIIKAFAAAIIAISAISCLGTGESYFTPASFYIGFEVQNQDGANLMDTTTVVNWADSTLTLVYKDNTYTCKAEAEMSTSAMNYGVYDAYNTLDQKNHKILAFGLFGGTAEIDDDIVLVWPDNSRDVIHLVNKGVWSKDMKGFTSLTRTIQLNGEYSETDILLIKKTVTPAEKPAEE